MVARYPSVTGRTTLKMQGTSLHQGGIPMALVRTRPRMWLNDPWGEFEELRHEMDRFFKPVLGRLPLKAEFTFYPAVDLIDMGEYLVAKIDLPGVPQENVDISFEGSRLAIRGQRMTDGAKEESYLYRERPFGPFVSTFDLPVDVNSNAIKATLQHGVLEIKLPKSETAAPKKIPLSVK